jgi:hypothetical protein
VFNATGHFACRNGIGIGHANLDPKIGAGMGTAQEGVALCALVGTKRPLGVVIVSEIALQHLGLALAAGTGLAPMRQGHASIESRLQDGLFGGRQKLTAGGLELDEMLGHVAERK